MSELVFDAVAYRYDNADAAAVGPVSFTVGTGRSLAILGPSGCGKSTLLQLAAGLLHPQDGRVSIDGAELSTPRKNTAYMLQNYGLLPWKTVLENAALGLIIAGQPRIQAYRRATEALARLGLDAVAQAWPRELSGGMRQRVALARALATDADLLLADEPLSALDALAREDAQDLLLQLWCEEGYTQVVVTHSVEEALFLGQRVLVLGPAPGRQVALVDNPAVGTRDTTATVELARDVRALLKGAAPECAA
ncbi:MAG: ABC transporter ATP-binding protein [Actinomycetes bacterium]|jgi:NitT/TauT family transport system ATP-binding protein|nr:ABC transporter ATP-binding protein [Actinomycetes bacterium]